MRRISLLPLRVRLCLRHALAFALRYDLCRAKIILHALVSNFEFALAVPEEDIGRKFGIVARPFVKSQTALGIELPLIVKRVAV